MLTVVWSFVDDSTAGSATIHTLTNALTTFSGFSTGGNAQLNTDAGGKVDFSQSAGPKGDFKLAVGSIEGAGTYLLGRDQLTVGLNRHSTEDVSGPIDDGGFDGGSGASLVKVGHDMLTLSHAFNTYSGGTMLEQGTLDLAAVDAAGTGHIAFSGKLKATLGVDTAALSGHVFGNEIDFFGKHDVLDLTGLKFHPGATATFHHEHLKVRSGGVTDVFTLLSPHGTHFKAANDGHGGTKVTLDPPPVTATAASLSPHDFTDQHWTTHTAGSAGHLSDFLFVT